MTGARAPAESAALRGRIVALRSGGLPLRAIAERLGVSKGVVAGHLHRAREAGEMPARPPPRARSPRPLPVPAPAAPARAVPVRTAPAPKRIIGRAVSPRRPGREAEREAWKRAQAHADRMASAPPLGEAEARALVERHLAEKGATRCPTMGQWSFDGPWERLGRR